MKCFYCGRMYTQVKNDEGKVQLVCKFPRCKCQPESDFHDTITECLEDMELIKESWRNAR